MMDLEILMDFGNVRLPTGVEESDWDLTGT